MAARWCCSCCWRAACRRCPARGLADPGEFTQRAFLNDKLDLAQAEAVADLIDASTEAAARSAGRSLAGLLGRGHALAERIVRLRMLVEATLDFPEEEIDFLEKADARGQLDAIDAAVLPRWRARARARCCARACAWCWPASPTSARARC
jgi:tRNA modification GTPase